MLQGIFDLSDLTTKRKLMVQIGAMTGPHRVEIKKFRKTRSERANAWWWAAVIPAFQEYEREQGNERTPDQCHTIIKLALLPNLNGQIR